VEAIAGRGVSATATTGIRFAFTRGTGERGSPPAIVVGVGAIVAGLIGATVFGASLNHLVDDPPSYGSNFDYTMGDNGGITIDPVVVEAFEASAEVNALTLYAVDDLRVGSKTVQVLGMQQKRGDGAPRITEGRLPASENEVAFGLVTARSLSLAVGDTVTLAGSSSSEELHVTGIAVITGFGANEGMGDGALMTLPGLQRLSKDILPSTLTVKVSSKERAVLERIVGSLGDRVALDQIGRAGGYRPTVIDNVDRVRSIPFVLAALLGALAILSVVHVMITARRRRRRDFAVLHALGAEEGWVRRAVHWQATAFTIVLLALAVPAGVVVGRLVFTAFAESMGAVTASSTPFALIAVSMVAFLALANVTVSLPYRRGRTTTTAQLLQSR
jgi:ABC-type lipoprotein release transport system permease subunit